MYYMILPETAMLLEVQWFLWVFDLIENRVKFYYILSDRVLQSEKLILLHLQDEAQEVKAIQIYQSLWWSKISIFNTSQTRLQIRIPNLKRWFYKEIFKEIMIQI